MNESETSAIARKLQHLILVENEGAAPVSRSRPSRLQVKEEPGIIKNIILIALMGMAVILTQMSLTLVKWTKQLEG